MCDRTKREILARELALSSWIGNRRAVLGVEYTDKVSFVEEKWEDMLNWADDLLESLDKHSTSAKTR